MVKCTILELAVILIGLKDMLVVIIVKIFQKDYQFELNCSTSYLITILKLFVIHLFTVCLLIAYC